MRIRSITSDSGWDVGGRDLGPDPEDPNRLSLVVPLQAVSQNSGGGTNPNAYQYKFYVTKDTPAGQVSVWLHDPANPSRIGDNSALEVVNFNSYLNYGEARRVYFSYNPGRTVRSVAVRGAFNSWNVQPMAMDPDGIRRCCPGSIPINSTSRTSRAMSSRGWATRATPTDAATATAASIRSSASAPSTRPSPKCAAAMGAW